MKTMSCPACRKQVSLEAPACPKCGHPISEEDREQGRKVNKAGKIGCLSILLILGLVVLFGGDKEQSADTSQPTPAKHTRAFAFTVKDFEQRFDAFLQEEVGVSYSLQYYDEQKGPETAAIHYEVLPNIRVLLSENVASGQVQEATMIGTSGGSIEGATDLLFVMGALMDGCVPDIQVDDRAAVLKGLGVTTGELAVDSGTRSYTHRGVNFWAMMSEEMGLWFGASPAE